MPKKIYNYSDFLKGLSPFSELLGGYAEARDVDPHRKPGYIMPGWADAETATSAGTLVGLILDAAVDPDNATATIYAIDTGKLYEMPGGTTFTADTDWPHAVATGSGVVFFECKEGGTSATKCFYIMDTDIGMSNVGTPDFDDTWLSATTAGGAALTSGPHPYLKWKSYLWVGDQNNLVKIDGQTGNEGTATMTALPLPVGWEITSLFPTQNYIGVCAWYKGASGWPYKTDCKIFFWDGDADDFNYYTPIKDNRITTSFNDGGDVYLMTRGKGWASALRKLTPTGDQLIAYLEFDKSGSAKRYYTTQHNTMDTLMGRMIIGASDLDYQNALFTYGSTNPAFPKVLLQPWSSKTNPDASNAGEVGYVGTLIFNFHFASYKIGTTYYWTAFTGNSTNALLKALYTDLGQKIRINYVKFYFKPLVASDSVTVSLDTDYGTVNPLGTHGGYGTITYALDSGKTSKRFNKPLLCHAFRPTISWTAGGVAFSKIVVDYDFVSDTD